MRSCQPLRPPKNPLRSEATEGEGKDVGGVPEGVGEGAGDGDVGLGEFPGEFVEVVGVVDFAAGLRGEAGEEIAVGFEAAELVGLEVGRPAFLDGLDDLAFGVEGGDLGAEPPVGAILGDEAGLVDAGLGVGEAGGNGDGIAGGAGDGEENLGVVVRLKGGVGDQGIPTAGRERPTALILHLPLASLPLGSFP